MTTPKMRVYSDLVAAISLKKKFDESKVKRNKGKFAKKAGSGAATPEPAKKTTAAEPPKPGKKMTNKVVYGKHTNGTIIETSDGQHRMVFNEAGNNWTFQERTPDGGWKVVDILGKGASYKKAQELSDEWGAPHAGTSAELTPVPGVTPSGSFAPGWDVISDPSLTNFKKLQILTAFKTANPSPEMHRGLMAKNVASIAQQYGVEPETVVALINQERGDTAFSDALQSHLKGDTFPEPTFAIKKATAAKKAADAAQAAKKTAAVVAPSPPPVAPSTPTPTAAPTYTALTNPFAQLLNGQPVELAALQQQSDASIEIDMLRMQMMHLSKTGAPFDEINAVSNKYIAARKKYSDTFGVAWSENHHKAVTQAYMDQLSGGSSSTLPDGTPIPGAPSGVAVGAKVKMTNGTTGTVVGPGTTAMGAPGVQIKHSDGTISTHPLGAAKKMSDAEEAAIAALPSSGGKVYHKTLGELTVVGGAYVDALGTLTVKVMKSDGTSSNLSLSSLSMTPIVPTAPTASTGPGIGAIVTTPGGLASIIDVSPSGKKAEVEFVDGTKAIVDMADVAEVPPSVVPSAPTPPPPPTPSASTPPSVPLGLPVGATVSTPVGNGVIVSNYANTAYKVKLSNGTFTVQNSGDVAEITPTAPPTSAPAPTPNPGTTYDANGVPLLTPDQKFKIESQFQNAGVNWYNPSEKLFDAAYAASQATGMSIEDVLKYADANFHNSSKDGGKPIQTKIAKWAKSSKGKAHIQATLGTAAAGPIVTSPTPSPTPAATPTLSPASPPPTPAAGGAALPGTPADISGISNAKQTAAFTQFTAGFVTLNDSPGVLAQKAVDVAKKTGLTPEQVLAIVDQKKADQAGVANGSLFANKILGDLQGKPWPSPTPVSTATSAGSTYVASTSTAFPVTPGYDMVTPASATQLQAQMVGASTPLTAGQTASLKYYTSNNYSKINACLRFNTGCTPAIKKHIAQGTAGMRPTTQNITTFRGTGLKAFGVNSIAELEQMVGKTVTEPGFSSTSISPGSAFGGQVAMQIEIPAGTMGSYVGNISHYKSEKEFLLPPGMKFKILEVQPASGGKKAFVRVEVVPA